MQKQTRYRILKFDIVCLDCSKNKKKEQEKIKRKEKQERKDAKLREVYSEIKTDSLCTSDRVIRFEQVIFSQSS